MKTGKEPCPCQFMCIMDCRWLAFGTICRLFSRNNESIKHSFRIAFAYLSTTSAEEPLAQNIYVSNSISSYLSASVARGTSFSYAEI
jgi:hypothetical protein